MGTQAGSGLVCERLALSPGPLCPPACSLTTSSLPVWSCAQGPCIGGGLNIALCADIRYAADTAIFCVPPAKLGIGYPLYMMGTLVSTGRLLTALLLAAMLLFRA